MLGDFEKGEETLQGLIDSHPDDAAGYALLSTHLGWTRHGDDYGDLSRAIDVLEQAVAHPVRNPDAWDIEQRLADLRAKQDK